jgi:orotate phosphoribosyltransferase-like protein
MTALEVSGASFTQIKKETRVNQSTVHYIVQQAKKLASKSQQLLFAPEHFHHDKKCSL